MHSNEIKDKFVELRAKSWSFDRIAEELNVSKRTLIRWQEEFGIQIENLRQIEFERVQERLLGSQAEQLEALIGEYQRYRNELLTRDPGRVPQYMLFRIVARLRDQLERRLVTPRFQSEPPETPSTSAGESINSLPIQQSMNPLTR
jgi:hypothetical protein